MVENYLNEIQINILIIMILWESFKQTAKQVVKKGIEAMEANTDQVGERFYEVVGTCTKEWEMVN